MRFLSTRSHGVLDYLVGASLILMPWLLGFTVGGAETWVPVLVGAIVIIYSLMTDYEAGCVGTLTMPTHMAFDAAAGVFLAASPWLFGFAGIVWLPHVVVGLLSIVVATSTRVVEPPASEDSVTPGP
ncbi:SPW repeat domain-containing protein [Tautonia marina]|uniref:SPW repeat domain-containing protein n=1 Tax=Tautonia marina TaxID=2653855 RepID=UPI001261353B|nr:SPW repeat protein [Tautonia marina]